MGTARRRSSGVSPLTAVLVFAVGTGVVVMASRGASGASGSAALCAGHPAVAGSVLDGVQLGPGQITNARLIYDIGTGLRLPQRAAVIAIATAMQESKLENVPYGTDDSLGLFQQRPSKGWGTPSEVMTPAYAATAFYRRLATIPRWQALPLAAAAQDVQNSAYPHAYAQWEPLGSDMAAAFGECVPAERVRAPLNGLRSAGGR